MSKVVGGSLTTRYGRRPPLIVTSRRWTPRASYSPNAGDAEPPQFMTSPPSSSRRALPNPNEAALPGKSRWLTRVSTLPSIRYSTARAFPVTGE